VRSIVEDASSYWEKINPSYGTATQSFMESRSLFINSAKAVERLQWLPVWKTQEALQRTVAWYREFYEKRNVITRQQLNEYLSMAKQKDLAWA
jgi:CDP-glucose 4,6-dehydratase